MELLAGEHIGALVVTAAAAGAAVPAARRWPVPVSRGLAVLIGATYLVEHAWFIARGTWSADFNLPLHLTDVVTIVSVLALWTARPLLVELTWFWGLTASLQAVLTPDLGHAPTSRSSCGGRSSSPTRARWWRRWCSWSDAGSCRGRERCGACSGRRWRSPPRRARRTC